MEVSFAVLLAVALHAFAQGEEMVEDVGAWRPAMGLLEKRQQPLCGTSTILSSGQSSPLISMNYPQNYPSVHYCTWTFQCPVNMTLQCSHFQLPWTIMCVGSAFIYNGRGMCASSTELQNPVNVGNYLTAVLYSVAYSSRGFECTVTCGQGSSAPITTPAPTPPANPCQCGISQGSKRLLGGIPVTDQGKYPWMVHITDPSRTLFFGGSLINDRYVLTSAFQVQQSASTTMYVTLGDLDVSTSTESTSIEVQATSILHPHFDITTYRNNIALLKLVTPVDFTAYPNIRPICISADADPAPGTQVSIAGWGGNVSSSAPVPVMTMQEAIVQVLDTAACQTQFTQVDQSFICTQPLANAVTNICTGDMGGPLMYQNPGGYIQNVGVASFSLCYPGYLYWTTGVFTRTSKYVDDFIDSNTSDAIWCPAP